jgi:hypothetical protein
MTADPIVPAALAALTPGDSISDYFAALRATRSGGYRFERLRAVEGAEARAEVIDFAVEDLHRPNLTAWERACVEAARLGKPAPQKPRLAFDLALCRAESRRIRVKRERDSSYFNQLTNPTPQY